MCDLALGVHAGVRPPRNHEFDRGAQHHRETVLQDSLDRTQSRLWAFLTGPSVEVGAVVGDVEAHPHRSAGCAFNSVLTINTIDTINTINTAVP